jgi:MFS family permease
MEAALIMVGVFGLSKAIANLFTGKLIAEIGRKRTLLLGWAMRPAGTDVITSFCR